MLLASWKGPLVAVKVLNEDSAVLGSSAAALADLRLEAHMLQAMRHPNVLEFYGACFDCKPVWLVPCSASSRSLA